MKKITKKFLSCFIAVLLIIISVFCAGAAVYITDNYGNVFQVNGSTVTYSGYQGTYSKVDIPAVFDNKPVVNIADFALKDNTVMDHLSFEFAYNLQSIGDYAFMGCNNISSVYLEKTDVKVGCGAFRDCNGLVYSEFYANNDVVPEELYYGCSSLNTVKLSKTLTKIEKHAFCFCSNLSYLEIPETVESIASCVFQGDDNLTLGVYYNSYAHQYAIDNNIPFVLLDFTLGDVNNDGTIDVLDSLIIQKYAVEKVELTDVELARADVNHDNYVDVIDALLIQKSLVGKYVI